MKTNYEWYLEALEEQRVINTKLTELKDIIVQSMVDNGTTAVAVERYNKVITRRTRYDIGGEIHCLVTEDCEVVKDES